MLISALLALAALQDVPPKTGRPFPDLILPDVEGGFGRVSDYRGRKLIVLSFASW